VTDNPPIREFIYLDGDITRSLYAQLEKGLVEQVTKGKEAHRATTGGIKGEIPFLGGGRVLLKDYRFMKELVSSHHDVLDSVSHFTARKQPHGSSGGKAKFVQTHSQNTYSRQDAKHIHQVLDWLHGDRLVLQVRPTCDPNRCFETDLEDDWLRFERDSLRFRYGVRFQGPWKVLCQVASVPAEEGPFPPTPGLDQMKQALDTLFEALRDWIAYTHVTAPVVSIVPIAVFRDIL